MDISGQLALWPLTEYKPVVYKKAIYQNIMWYAIWNELKLETLTPEQKDLLGFKFSEFPPLTLNHLGKRIKKFDTSYPWSVPPMLY